MSEEIKVNETVETASQEALEHIVSLKKGDTVKGTIVKIDDNQAVVSIGYKYDGIIPVRELAAVSVDNATDVVKVGQEVECKVVSINDEKEHLVLSKRQVDSEQAWDDMQKHFEEQDVFEVIVADVVKGGIVADVGVRAFIPASMVERHFVEDFSDYKGRTLRVKVKEMDRPNNKLILSQKDVLDEEFEANKTRVLEGLTGGQEIEGTVQRLTHFGVFVDVGGVDGLVHVSELAWSHVDKPSDVVSQGQKVKVKVLKVDPANGKISLSMKATQPGPWEQAANHIQTGDILTGEVKRLVDFGAFVEVAPGVEGLVHISQIAHRHIATPHEVLKQGQSVQMKVLDFNPAEKRVSLSIKETDAAPVSIPKPEKKGKEGINNPNGALNHQAMNVTLGERFGNMLNKFKN